MKATVKGLAILCALGLAAVGVPQNAFSGACQKAPEACCETDTDCGSGDICIQSFGLCQSSDIGGSLGDRDMLCVEDLDCGGKCKYATQTGWPGPEAPAVDCTVPEDCSPSTNGYVCQLTAAPCDPANPSACTTPDVCVLDVCLPEDECMDIYTETHGSADPADWETRDIKGRCVSGVHGTPYDVTNADQMDTVPSFDICEDDSDCRPGSWCVQPGGCTGTTAGNCYAGLPTGTCAGGTSENLCDTDAGCWECTDVNYPGFADAHCATDAECGGCAYTLDWPEPIPCATNADCPSGIPDDCDISTPEGLKACLLEIGSVAGVCTAGPNKGEYCWPVLNTLTEQQDCPHPVSQTAGICMTGPLASGGYPTGECCDMAAPDCTDSTCYPWYHYPISDNGCGPVCSLQPCLDGTCDQTPICTDPGQPLCACEGGLNDGGPCQDDTDCEGWPCWCEGSCEGKRCSNDPSQECEKDMDCGGLCKASLTPCTADEGCPLGVCSLHQDVTCATDDDCDWDCWVDGVKTGIDCPPGDDAYCENNPQVGCDPETELCVCLTEESCILHDVCEPSYECTASGDPCWQGTSGLREQRCVQLDKYFCEVSGGSCGSPPDPTLCDNYPAEGCVQVPDVTGTACIGREDLACDGCSATGSFCSSHADCRNFCERSGDWDCGVNEDCPLVCSGYPHEPCATLGSTAECNSGSCEYQECIIQLCEESCEEVYACYDTVDQECTTRECYTDADCGAGELCNGLCDVNCGLGECDISINTVPDPQCGLDGSCETCMGGVEPPPPPPPDCTDADGDGYAAQGGTCGQIDCNDGDASVNPGETEGPPGDPTCADGKDNDCDTLVDAADAGCEAPSSCVPEAAASAAGMASGTEVSGSWYSLLATLLLMVSAAGVVYIRRKP